MTTSDSVWVVRPHAPVDLLFVFDAWLKSYWDGINRDPWATTWKDGQRVGIIETSVARDKLYNVGQRALIASAIGSSTCAIACHRENADGIMGFACGHPGVLHYVYVKAPFRRSGIARDLLAHVLGDGGEHVQVTHLTKGAMWLMKDRDWTFDPNF